MEQTIKQLATVLNIEFIRGDDLFIPLSLKTNVGTAEEPVYEPIDITGWQFEAMVRQSAKKPVVTSWVIEVVDEATGDITMDLPADRTALLSRPHVYDLQVTNAAGRKRTWMRGTLSPTLDQTRDE